MSENKAKNNSLSEKVSILVVDDRADKLLNSSSNQSMKPRPQIT